MAGGNTMRCGEKGSRPCFLFSQSCVFELSEQRGDWCLITHDGIFLTSFDAGYFSPPVEEYDHRSPIITPHEDADQHRLQLGSGGAVQEQQSAVQQYSS
jgi:hypothetical protein